MNNDTKKTNTININKNETQEKKPINWKKEIISWVILIAAAFILAYCITHFVIIKSDIPSGSMEKTIMTHDKIVGNRLAYLFGDPDRGDIIIFALPDDESQTFIKRVIGLPGETVEVIDGKVYIDGASTPIDEPYLWEPMEGSFGPYEVPDDSYFVMGDNRNVSIDARRWDNKYVKRDAIYAEAWFRYSPSLSFID